MHKWPLRADGSPSVKEASTAIQGWAKQNEFEAIVRANAESAAAHVGFVAWLLSLAAA